MLADTGSINFVILPRATGTVEIPGQPKMTLEDAVRSGRTQPCAELSGAQQMALPSGGKARMEIDGLVFQVARGHRGQAARAGAVRQLRLQHAALLGLSLLGAHRPHRRDGVLRAADGPDRRRRAQPRSAVPDPAVSRRRRRARAGGEGDRAGRRDQRRQQGGRHRNAREG